MKTNNFKQMTKAVSLVTLFAALTACPPKNSTNNTTNNPVVNGYTNCTNCGDILVGQEFLSTESVELNNLFTLRLGLSGTTIGTNSFGYNPSNYQGAVAANRGELIFSQGLYQGNCQVPAGNYGITTLNVGQYQNGIVSGLRLVATGPSTTLIIVLDSAQIASPTNRDQYGMLLPYQRLFSTRTLIESVNGLSCQIPFTLR